MTETIQKIVNAIRQSRTVLITSHEGPDVMHWSSLGLLHFEGDRQAVVVHLADPVPELYRFLPGADLVCSDIPDQDLILLCAGCRRVPP